jgi:hypothetical protein
MMAVVVLVLVLGYSLARLYAAHAATCPSHKCTHLLADGRLHGVDVLIQALKQAACACVSWFTTHKTLR